MVRMTDISAALPSTDGLACFNRMYLIVTQRVFAEVAKGNFYADQDFMFHLDVVFANLYLGAIDEFRADQPTSPRCWNDVLDNRTDTHIAPMQFALAGMSAHIIHDLPVAVVKTCEDLGTAPGPHAADYEKVNTVLGALDQQIRESFETGEILDLDRKAAGLENLVGNFGIDTLRQAAWDNALRLWDLRHEGWLSKEYIDGLDLAANLAEKALLLPLL
jgi:Family of unknown function (DUF5995)